MFALAASRRLTLQQSYFHIYRSPVTMLAYVSTGPASFEEKFLVVQLMENVAMSTYKREATIFELCDGLMTFPSTSRL